MKMRFIERTFLTSDTKLHGAMLRSTWLELKLLCRKSGSKPSWINSFTLNKMGK